MCWARSTIANASGPSCWLAEAAGGGCGAARVTGSASGKEVACRGPLAEEFWEDIGLCCCTVDGKGSWHGRLQGDRRPVIRFQRKARKPQQHTHYQWLPVPEVINVPSSAGLSIAGSVPHSQIFNVSLWLSTVLVTGDIMDKTDKAPALMKLTFSGREIGKESNNKQTKYWKVISTLQRIQQEWRDSEWLSGRFVLRGQGRGVWEADAWAEVWMTDKKVPMVPHSPTYISGRGIRIFHGQGQVRRKQRDTKHNQQKQQKVRPEGWTRLL